MFLSQLTEPEKAAFLALAREMVALNGVMAAETEMLAAACREMGLAIDQPVFLTFEAACAGFCSDRSRKIALMELMLLAKADGLVQAEESDLAKRIQVAFGAGADVLAWAKRWAELSLEPFRQGVRYLGEVAPVTARQP